MKVQCRRRAGLVVASIVLSLFLFEMGARLILPPPRYHREPLEFDSVLGFRGIPFYSYEWASFAGDEEAHPVSLNRDGFRGRHLPEPGTVAEGQRMLFLGDSFLVGEAVPEEALITSRIEAQQIGRDGHAEVYNLSTIDYGTGQQLLRLEQQGEALQPDIVVLALYPSNDVANNSIGLAGQTTVSPGDPIRPYLRIGRAGEIETEWVMPLRARARRGSRVFGWLERGWFPPRLMSKSTLAPIERVRLGRTPHEFLEVYVRHPDSHHRWEVAWRETESLMRAMHKRCDALGSKLVVVVIPSVHQVEMTARTIRFEIEARLGGKALDDLLDWNSPERRLQSFLMEEGIDAVFLLSDFREWARNGTELFSRDQHLSRSGHALAARRILEDLYSDRSQTGDESDALLEIDEPVAWPATDDLSWLDLRRESHSRHFGDGWIGWRRGEEGVPGGWQLGSSPSLVAVHMNGRNLVIRGFAFGPVRLELRLLGSRNSIVEIAEAGDFERTIALPTNLQRGEKGHVAIGLSTLNEGDLVQIQGIGFPGTSSAEDESPAATQ